MARQMSYLTYWRPNYWPMWGVLAVARCLAILPLRVQYVLGAFIGSCAYSVLKNRRRIAKVNIDTCFPELTEHERQALVKECFRSNGIGLLETLRSWFVSPERLRSQCQIEGLEHLDKALEGGKGVILLGGHFSTLDLVGSLTTLYFEADVVQRDHSNPLFNAFMTRSRERLYGSVIAKKNLRGMLKSLRQNHIVWYATDQDYGHNGTCFVDFFGQPCSTLTMTMRLAKMSGATVISFSHFRSSHGTYKIVLKPGLKDFPSADIEADAQRLNQILEQEIRKAPEQYLWMHRRFKTTKDGDKNIYQLDKEIGADN